MAEAVGIEPTTAEFGAQLASLGTCASSYAGIIHTTLGRRDTLCGLCGKSCWVYASPFVLACSVWTPHHYTPGGVGGGIPPIATASPQRHQPIIYSRATAPPGRRAAQQQQPHSLSLVDGNSGYSQQRRNGVVARLLNRSLLNGSYVALVVM